MNRGNQETNKVIRLEWDSNFFGFSIGRIYANALTGEHLRKGLERAEKDRITFVELFCDVSDDESIDAAEQSGFHLADLRMTLKKKLDGELKDDRLPGDLIFKKAGGDDIDRLKTMSNGLFTYSRYYRYQKFDRNQTDLMFQVWVEKSVRGEFDDELYYLSDQRDILAFCSLRYKGNASSIGLFGINRAHRNRGLGSLILNRVFHLLYKRGVIDTEVITQGKNPGALHLYQKNGFCVAMITLSYYKWLD
jgi:dTDP-4-amino-4,6-dideoxy-D-galactose acyltransferase